MSDNTSPDNKLAPSENLAAMTPRQFVASNYIRDQVSKALPSIFTPERFMRVTLTAFNQNPKLWDCSKESIANCIMRSAQWGLEPDGRNCYLIPYKGEATLQLDYKGLITLIRRSGEVSTIHADVVCEADDFEYNMGQVVKHSINYKKPRGEIYCVYATASLKDGTTQSVVMTRDEVDSIRKQSRTGDSGPWQNSWGEMAKKTAFKRLSKWLPMSFEAATALDYDTKREFGNTDSDVVINTERPTAAKILAKPEKPKKPKKAEDVEPFDVDDGI